VLVGFAVLFLRLEDGDAWLLAVLFASFVAAPSFNNYGALPAQLHRFVSLYRTVFFSLIGSLFYIFLRVIPRKISAGTAGALAEVGSFGAGIEHAFSGVALWRCAVAWVYE
jgi:hypothetical protein